MNRSAIDTLEDQLETMLAKRPAMTPDCIFCGAGISSAAQIENPATDVCERCAEGGSDD